MYCIVNVMFAQGRYAVQQPRSWRTVNISICIAGALADRNNAENIKLYAP